jgi:hypothetical protein
MRVLLGLLAVVLVAAVTGCSADEFTEDDTGYAMTTVSGSRTDKLLREISAGGDRRDKAAEEIAQGLEEEDKNLLDGASGTQVMATLDALNLEALEFVEETPPVCGSWAHHPDYLPIRYATEVVIDLAGRAGFQDAAQDFWEFNDPYLAAWGLGAGPDNPYRYSLERAAVDDHARSVLYLYEHLEDDLPEKYKTEKAKAASDMAQWLAHPNELACQPKDLEVWDRLLAKGAFYYVFRFRAGGDAKDANEWQVGISGPWEDGELAETSKTFSDFKPASAGPPEEHLDRILKTVP